MKDMPVDDKDLVGIEAIIQSMTKAERRDPDLINPSRRLRIAKGAGRRVDEVNQFIKQFKQFQKVFKGLGKMPGMRQMFGSGRKELEDKVKHLQQQKTKKKKPF